ncbi:Clavaminate synthase-like protein [Gonapodya prolifera JEL478]|uniref:Clavaminate synthase-like protein n=1 Tax=Gonapodya prolifera (strain JEL478) TaxID=1344416 RepID=A0A139AKD2_GONPJ|nr:Clavaminate synthase-like protein [Gonapodya prolifera JEL478]|eukprot:KXS17240.1 Clavaminate synthase-like protein [Gonapodya prolifera JEL478]
MSTTISVRPLTKFDETQGYRGSMVNFGAEVIGADLDNLSAQDFAVIERALEDHQVLVIRGQQHMAPASQVKFALAFDPSAECTIHHHGDVSKNALNKSHLLGGNTPVPGLPQLHVIGNGTIHDHYGIESFKLKHPSHADFHATAPPLGNTRYYRWHIDAALYDKFPPRVTTFRTVQPVNNPAKPPIQTLSYDDGSGDEIAMPVGATAYVSGYTAFELLPVELKEWALRTKVLYPPHPYAWAGKCKAESTGCTLVSEGKEVPLDELPPWEEERLTVLPLVWRNPLTCRPSLQLHGIVASAFVTKNPDGSETTMDDLPRVRERILELMRPAVGPEYVLAVKGEAGDLLVWDNWTLWHSVMSNLDGDDPGDLRIMHQCNLAASYPPEAWSPSS